MEEAWRELETEYSQLQTSVEGKNAAIESLMEQVDRARVAHTQLQVDHSQLRTQLQTSMGDPLEKTVNLEKRLKQRLTN